MGLFGYLKCSCLLYTVSILKHQIVLHFGLCILYTKPFDPNFISVIGAFCLYFSFSILITYNFANKKVGTPTCLLKHGLTLF